MMAHNFVALLVSALPETILADVPSFNGLIFNNDGQRALLDGYKIDGNNNFILDSDGKKVLVHPDWVVNSWLKGAANKEETLQHLKDSAIEYTKEEFHTKRADPNSIWYADEGDL